MLSRSAADVSQAGFSLVELMIGLALGALITISAVQLFSTNQRTFALQRALTEIQEQGRFTLDFIARDLRRVGFTRPAIGGEAGVILDPFDLLGVNVQGSVDNGGNPEVSRRLALSQAIAGDREGFESSLRPLLLHRPCGRYPSPHSQSSQRHPASRRPRSNAARSGRSAR